MLSHAKAAGVPSLQHRQKDVHLVRQAVVRRLSSRHAAAAGRTTEAAAAGPASSRRAAGSRGRRRYRAATTRTMGSWRTPRRALQRMQRMQRKTKKTAWWPTRKLAARQTDSMVRQAMAACSFGRKNRRETPGLRSDCCLLLACCAASASRGLVLDSCCACDILLVDCSHGCWCATMQRPQSLQRSRAHSRRTGGGSSRTRHGQQEAAAAGRLSTSSSRHPRAAAAAAAVSGRRRPALDQAR